MGMAGCAALGFSQTKISGTGKCEKPETQQSVDVGDRTGHALVLVKQQCTWNTPIEMEGLKTKTYVVTAIGDSSTNKASTTKEQDNGYVVITMDNGDQAFVRFRGTSAMEKGQPVSGEGTWSYTGGTGKLKGITGKGTYKNSNGEDQVEGEYSIAAAKPSAKK